MGADRVSWFNEINNKNKNKPMLALEGTPLNKIAKIICQHLEISIDDLSSDSQKMNISLARSMLAYFGHYHAKYTLRDIACILAREPDSVSKTMKRHIKKSLSCQQTRAVMKSLEQKLAVSDLDTITE